MKIKVEDKTVVRTFVQLDDYECELAHLYDVVEGLGECDLVLQDDQLRDKLIKAGVADHSVFRGSGITRGKKFDTFSKRIVQLYKKKYHQEEDDS